LDKKFGRLRLVPKSGLSAELLGPVLAGGLLLGLLEGAAAGGLLGLLVGLGIPEPRARASVQASELGRDGCGRAR
jgi:hypothetical protein